MLACSEVLTLVRHIREDDGDRYECAAIHGGSWYRKTSIALSGDGAKPVGTCSVRFPPEALDGAGPKVGDYLVRGRLSAVQRAPKDFGGLDYIQVTTVSDNRRGRLPHWGVSGA